MHVLGLDPAADGAAVLLDLQDGRPSVVAAWAWTQRQRQLRRGWLVQVWTNQGLHVEHWCDSPGRVGRLIATFPPMPDLEALVIEAPYVGRNAQSALRIARFGGLVAGGIQAHLGDGPACATEEISPSGWRAVLGLSAADREQAKARSLAGIPVLLPSIVPALTALGALDHVTDAAGVAMAGARCGAGLPGFADRVEAAIGHPRRRRR